MTRLTHSVVSQFDLSQIKFCKFVAENSNPSLSLAKKRKRSLWQGNTSEAKKDSFAIESLFAFVFIVAVERENISFNENSEIHE